jgi:hypothetical protein
VCCRIETTRAQLPDVFGWEVSSNEAELGGRDVAGRGFVEVQASVRQTSE